MIGSNLGNALREQCERLRLKVDWPKSWVDSYSCDREEVFGKPTNLGYAYAYRNRRKQTLRLVTEVVKPDATILDVAAAQGNFTSSGAWLSSYLERPESRFSRASYVQRKHERGDVSYMVGNALELTLGFDCVLFCGDRARGTSR